MIILYKVLYNYTDMWGGTSPRYPMSHRSNLTYRLGWNEFSTPILMYDKSIDMIEDELCQRGKLSLWECNVFKKDIIHDADILMPKYLKDYSVADLERFWSNGTLKYDTDYTMVNEHIIPVKKMKLVKRILFSSLKEIT